jgi:transcription termination factor Rho
MAEGNEQPSLLREDAGPQKKPKRGRSVTGSNPKRAPARKSGGKRPGKSNDRTATDRSYPEGQLSEMVNRPVNEGDSELTTVNDSVRDDRVPSVAGNEITRTEGKPTNHRTNEAPEANEAREGSSFENGRNRVQAEVVVEQSRPEPVYGEGLIEVSGKGFGFLRDPKRNYVQSPQDIFVTPEVVRKHALRDGLWIKGEIRRGSRGPQLFKLTEINGEDPERYRNLPVFEELTSINPVERIRLETVSDRYTTRVMDLMTPIGKGQRGLIVAPPRTGKTTLLQHIADAVVRNHPETSLIILLVDERPEEVTEIRRGVPKADIMASSNDSDIKSHTRIAQLAIERAKRLVEANRDVFVLMDSLTRVGRAFNNASAGSGRTMSGGMDSRAMEIPRKLFAAARNTEEAGSLTIMATALIETGSKMDELIFQEFKGTGNMEMVLDRQISDQRTYPSVDIFKSGTRREELLLPERDLEKINTIRRGLAGHRPTEAIERLLSFLRKFPTNAQMLREIPG